MSDPMIVRTDIRHTRHRPVRHSFHHRSYSWLVDLDELPCLPMILRPLAQFRAADHLGDRSNSLRANIDSYLASEGIDLGGGRVRMLANARVLGYVFNPLTVYWCRDAAGALVCVVAEVHNTYGDRHRYLLRLDDHGNDCVAKVFYVSPFNPVSGTYRLHMPEPERRLGLAITLDDSGGTVFGASMTGRPAVADNRTILLAALRTPLAPLLVALQIRLQGIRLWRRGLTIHPRPTSQECPR